LQPPCHAQVELGASQSGDAKGKTGAGRDDARGVNRGPVDADFREWRVSIETAERFARDAPALLVAAHTGAGGTRLNLEARIALGRLLAPLDGVSARERVEDRPLGRRARSAGHQGQRQGEGYWKSQST
jgi:hypothetical protein